MRLAVLRLEKKAIRLVGRRGGGPLLLLSLLLGLLGLLLLRRLARRRLALLLMMLVGVRVLLVAGDVEVEAGRVVLGRGAKRGRRVRVLVLLRGGAVAVEQVGVGDLLLVACAGVELLRGKTGLGDLLRDLDLHLRLVVSSHGGSAPGLGLRCDCYGGLLGISGRVGWAGAGLPLARLARRL